MQLKYLNRRLMLNYIRKYGPVTKSELAKETGLTFMAINKIFAEYESLGLICKLPRKKSGSVGRNANTFSLDAQYGYTIAVHINAYRTEVAVLDLRANILATHYILMDQLNGRQDAFIHQLIGAINEVVAQSKIDIHSILGIGIGSPGPVDAKKGIIGMAPNLPLLHYLPIKDALEKRLELPVLLAKDTNAIALGEYWHGKGRIYQDLLYVDLDMGIGGALVSGGNVRQGSGSMAGEIGHMLLVPEGPLCNCGNRGCLEALSSALAIIRDGERELTAQAEHPLYQLRNQLTVELIVDAANQGDLLFSQLLQRSAYHVGVAVRNMINIFDPQLIILGGLLVQKVPSYSVMVKDVALSLMMKGSSERTVIEAEPDVHMALIGCGELVSHHFFENQVFS